MEYVFIWQESSNHNEPPKIVNLVFHLVSWYEDLLNLQNFYNENFSSNPMNDRAATGLLNLSVAFKWYQFSKSRAPSVSQFQVRSSFECWVNGKRWW